MDKRNSQRPLVTACLLSLGLAGCSSGGLSTSPYPYQVGKTNVIGASDTGSAGSVDGSAGSRNATGSPSSTLVGVAPVATYTTPTDAAACIDVQGTCVKPQKDCGTDGTADVILGPNGEVLSTICYPNRDYKVVVLGDAPVSSPPLGNNSVIVLDNKDDGVDVQGNLKITGNNVIVWGYGPDTSVIGGNLDIDKNNAIVRGVRVNGDVSITKNNAALIDCVIDGNLTITGNNVSLALCQIWGTVTIEGKNTVLVSNLVLGDQVISGDNLRCNDNHRFADANTDGVFQDAEVTGPVTCESRGQAVTDTTNLTPKKP
jgi:hypothetical protein